jgi:putative acetyltransferase
MHIRLHRQRERLELLELWERSVRATHAFLTDTDIAFYRPLVADFFASEGLELYVLTGEAEPPVGFLAVSGNAIEALFLDPTHRGRGAGRQLVDYAQRLRPGALTVDVNEQNPTARGFYETLGFRVVGRSPLDGTGRPFPLLHMRRDAPIAAHSGAR